MAEAEDVIIDAARHATVYVRGLWQRHRAPGPQPLRLADVTARLDLLVSAVFGRSLALRVAQPPAPPTFLALLFRRNHGPLRRRAIPATDGHSIWLPDDLGADDLALARWRTMALQQAMRAARGSAAHVFDAPPLLRDLYLLHESHAADAALLRWLPGSASALQAARRAALTERPPLAAFPAALQPLERQVRDLLAAGCGDAALPICASPLESQTAAAELAGRLYPDDSLRSRLGPHPLYIDDWTGELRAPATAGAAPTLLAEPGATPDVEPRSARLARRPQVREAADDEDDRQPGAWMIQTAQPHEQAEDPHGLQRPTDRDDETAAEEYADALSELAEARLVATPAQAPEVLLSDDPPQARARRATGGDAAADATRIRYPEWDWRRGSYREPGATVHLQAAVLGPQRWVDATLSRHRKMLGTIRRQFEMLRPHRQRLRRQLDGDELDLDACIESQADFRAGLPLTQTLYQRERRARRDMAVSLLIDVSGSTDGWIGAERRVIDVEREALLLVCLALDGLGEPYAVHAFSGEGPQAVTVRELKRYDERYDSTIARRIAALEPEHYTRVGAALRHATAGLMQQPAHHRLLLLLSDGKPNDVDDYEGRYGVEDLRQAVIEARLQGIFPFCLTIDRQAAGYLPGVFGAGRYAVLTRPEALPTVLLGWMRRLLET